MSSDGSSAQARIPGREHFPSGPLPWAGVGLLGAGSLVAVVAAYWIVMVHNGILALFAFPLFLAAVGAVLVLWALAAAALRRWAAGRGFVGAGVATWFGIGAGAVALAVSPALLAPDYDYGPWVAAAWSGLVLAAVGTVLLMRWDGYRGPRPKGGPLGMVSGTAAAVLVAAAAWGWGLDRAVQHTTVEADHPETRGTDWIEELPEGAETRILPTAAGMVVETGDGVVALDAATGEETWRYRLAGVTVWVDVSPDARSVRLTAVRMGDEGKPFYRFAFLDAATGELLDTRPPGFE